MREVPAKVEPKRAASGIASLPCVEKIKPITQNGVNQDAYCIFNRPVAIYPSGYLFGFGYWGGTHSDCPAYESYIFQFSRASVLQFSSAACWIFHRSVSGNLSLWVLIRLCIFGRNAFRLSHLRTLHLRHHRVQSCRPFISSIKTNPRIFKFSRATVLQLLSSALSATLSIASNLIGKVDLPSTLNFTLSEVRSLSLSNCGYLTPFANRIMQIKTFVNAVALALLTAGAHARVPSGTYSIVNRIHSIHGDRRAITFYGEGQELTTQRWIRSNSQQVYSASINHPVYLFITHPSEVGCERL